MALFRDLMAMIERDGAASLVSVREVQGSSPRNVGAHMLVRRDGAFSGSIGGGALEWRAMAEAQALLAAKDGRTIRLLDQALGPDLGQCCGGRVKIAIERFGPADLDWIAPLAVAEHAGVITTIAEPMPGGALRRRLFVGDSPPGALIETFGTDRLAVLIAGAGHVGRALVLALAPLPFAVTWVDPRPDAFPGVAPQNVATLAGSPVDALAALPDGAMILAMTHSHALDLEIVDAALRAGRFSFVGVIGSATKRARFVSQLRKAGLDLATIERLVCPIGIQGLGGKEPAIIAASVAAQLLIERDALAQQQSAQKAHHVG